MKNHCKVSFDPVYHLVEIVQGEPRSDHPVKAFPQDEGPRLFF